MEAFRAIMLAGSITAAARAQGLSQPSLTRTLRRIEDIVGFGLFERLGNRLAPTPEAQALLAKVQHLRGQLDTLDEAIGQIRLRGHGPFRLAASPAVARQLVPAALAGVRRHFPDAPLHLDTLPLSRVVDYLALGQGECFVTLEPISHPAVECRPIWPGYLVCVLPAGHALARRASLRPDDLTSHPLILCEPGTAYGEMQRQVLHEAGVDPVAGVIVRVAETAIGFAASGMGAAVLDEFTALDAASDKVVVRPLDSGPRFNLHLNRNTGVARSRHLRAFEDELMALLKRPGG
jgi:DNA-binding transcriptional LysR family regulator